MTENHSEHVVLHTDNSRAASQDRSDDGRDKVASKYEQYERNTAYSNVENRGQDVEIQTPVWDVAELNDYAHLSVLIGETKRDHVTYDSTAEGVEPAGAGDAAFDTAILDLTVPMFAAEGLTIQTLPIEPCHARAVFLQRARSESLRTFETHLKNEPDIAAAVGYDDERGVRSYSTLSLAAKELEKHGMLQHIKNAAKRAVHAAERRGELIPYAARHEYGLAIPSVIDERVVPPPTRRKEIVRWVETLLPALIDPLTFNREDPEYSVQQVVGMLAQAALINGPESARSSASWHYDASEMPSSRQVLRLVHQHDRRTILRQFNSVREQLIEIASDHGFFAEPYDYALDPTWVNYDGEKQASDPDTYLINNPEECESGVGWCFTAVTATDRDARFMFGVDIAKRKDERTGQFRRMLREVASQTRIGRPHIDREFCEGDAVQLCRALASENWVIRAKTFDKGDIPEKIEQTPAGESELYEDIAFNNMENTPNLYVHAVPDAYKDRIQTDHIVFLTDLTEETANLEGIFRRYLYRWSQEVAFRQLKHDLLPVTESSDGEVRLFLFNIASIFYNIHTLINRAIGPTYALRLNVPYYEVLQAIVEVTFSRSPPTEP